MLLVSPNQVSFQIALNILVKTIRKSIRFNLFLQLLFKKQLIIYFYTHTSSITRDFWRIWLNSCLNLTVDQYHLLHLVTPALEIWSHRPPFSQDCCKFHGNVADAFDTAVQLVKCIPIEWYVEVHFRQWYVNIPCIVHWKISNPYIGMRRVVPKKDTRTSRLAPLHSFIQRKWKKELQMSRRYFSHGLKFRPW